MKRKNERIELPKYGARVFWSEEDGEYVAVGDELPFVTALGSSPAEAVSEWLIAMEAVLEVMGENGQPLPPVRQLETEYSGKLNVRLGRALHREAADSAEREGISLNQFIQTAIARACERASSGLWESGIDPASASRLFRSERPRGAAAITHDASHLRERPAIPYGAATERKAATAKRTPLIAKQKRGVKRPK